MWVASCSLEVSNPILSRARRTIPMPSDEQDKAGVLAPPPLIYLVALIFGLLMGRRFPMRFLPRTMTRPRMAPARRRGAAPGLVRVGHAPGRHAYQSLQAGPAHSHGRPLSLHPQPRIPGHDADLRGHRQPGERAVGHPSSAGSAVGDPAWGQRTRGALPGGEVRRRIPELQSTSEALDLSDRPYSPNIVEDASLLKNPSTPLANTLQGLKIP